MLLIVILSDMNRRAVWIEMLENQQHKFRKEMKNASMHGEKSILLGEIIAYQGIIEKLQRISRPVQSGRLSLI